MKTDQIESTVSDGQKGRGVVLTTRTAAELHNNSSLVTEQQNTQERLSDSISIGSDNTTCAPSTRRYEESSG